MRQHNEERAICYRPYVCLPSLTRVDQSKTIDHATFTTE